MIRYLFVVITLSIHLVYPLKTSAQIPRSKKLVDSSYYYDFEYAPPGSYVIYKNYCTYDSLRRQVRQVTKVGSESIEPENYERLTFIFNSNDISKAPDTTIKEQWFSNLAFVNVYRHLSWQSPDKKQTIWEREEWSIAESKWKKFMKTVTRETLADTVLRFDLDLMYWNDTASIWDTVPDKGVEIKWNNISIYKRFPRSTEEWFTPGDSSIRIYKKWNNDSLKFVNNYIEVIVSSKGSNEMIRYEYHVHPFSHTFEDGLFFKYKTISTEQNGNLKTYTVYIWDADKNVWLQAVYENCEYDFENDLTEISMFGYRLETGLQPVSKTLYFYQGGVPNGKKDTRIFTLRDCLIPNPVESAITLDGPCFNEQQYYVILWDLTGRVLEKQYIKKGQQIDLASIRSSQLCFIRIINEQNNIVLSDKVLVIGQ